MPLPQDITPAVMEKLRSQSTASIRAEAAE